MAYYIRHPDNFCERTRYAVRTRIRQIGKFDRRRFWFAHDKIGQFKSSSALAENLKNIKKNAAEFESLASSKNLKPQFLAIAALAKIGNAPGNPLEVAKTMLPVLGELKATLANNLADDNLLIIAGYERGAAGKPRALQSIIEALGKTVDNASAREIRTICFSKTRAK